MIDGKASSAMACHVEQNGVSYLCVQVSDGADLVGFRIELLS